MWMVEVGGSSVDHFLWVTSKAIISKKANVWNRNASDIPEILILLIYIAQLNHFILNRNHNDNIFFVYLLQLMTNNDSLIH